MNRGRITSSKNGRYHGSSSDGTRSAEISSFQSKVLLSQLSAALAVFLIVFIGKGSDLQQVAKAKERILETITYNIDLRFAVEQFENTLSASELTKNLFFDIVQEKEPEQETESTIDAAQNLTAPSLAEINSSFLTSNEGLAERYLYMEPKVNISTPLREQTQPVQTDSAIPAAGTIIAYSDYSGDPVPARYTMDHLSLGAIETVTPVLGYLNSPFGYRVHPINGKKGFHAGVDISGKYGDPIAAFAAGTVDYIGEDDSYGLYTQIDHGNGVKSFYAHCQSLQVKQGQAVSAGEHIGTVGSSGNTTGPHLHLEIKWAGKYLDPLYYIEVLES